MKAFVLTSAALTLSAGSAFAQPANDSCSAPQLITGYGQTETDNTGATVEGPDTCVQCNNDVWFLWTAPESVNVRINTCFAGVYDTVLSVYQGADCPSGGEIACSDDACGTRSQVEFDAIAGQQYLIRLGGYFTFSFGAATLTIGVTPPPPPPGTLAGPIVNEANGHSYYLLESSSWTVAEQNAVAMGGHLATIRSVEEHEFVFNSVLNFDGPGFRRGWIGLNDEGREPGDYVWTSGEPVTFTFWGGGEPNHANGTEFYAQIPWFGAGRWNDNSDMPGDDPTYGIVEVITNPPACAADLGMAGGEPGADGLLDNNDFIAFINYFFDANAAADVGVAGGEPGSDGLFDNNDFIAFINFFFEGC